MSIDLCVCVCVHAHSCVLAYILMHMHRLQKTGWDGCRISGGIRTKIKTRKIKVVGQVA